MSNLLSLKKDTVPKPLTIILSDLTSAGYLGDVYVWWTTKKQGKKEPGLPIFSMKSRISDTPEPLQGLAQHTWITDEVAGLREVAEFCIVHIYIGPVACRNFLNQGLNLCPLHSKQGVLTIGPPGKSRGAFWTKKQKWLL